jgi:uncharacterized protein
MVKSRPPEQRNMARVDVHDDSVELSDPVLVEGLPGAGLVGKIATDHLVSELGMTYYASVADCEGLPSLAMYAEGDHDVRPPVRIYADEAADLLALQSDVPIPKEAASAFADCVTDWLAETGATPLYLSGLPTDEKSAPPAMFGVRTGGADEMLARADVRAPSERGLVAGPTGALMAEAGERDLPSVALVVESNERFPDPEAARVVLQDGIQPIAEVDVPLETLVEQATEIRDAKEQLAQQVQDASQEERTEAKPLRMYQ